MQPDFDRHAERPIPARQTQSACRQPAQRIAFRRRDVRQQAVLFALHDPKLRPTQAPRELALVRMTQLRSAFS